MGWLFSNQTRSELISKLTRSEENDIRKRFCLAHTTRGNVLWTVWEVTLTDEGMEDRVKRTGFSTRSYRYIGCDLLAKRKYDGWGYKDMDESVAPYYYTCPISYLSMVQDVACQEWRDKVIAKHRAKTLVIEKGDIFEIEGCSVKLLKATMRSTRGIIAAISRDGVPFMVPRKYLTGKKLETWP